jgi:glycosyltransferase involved in cell wall biosynthesis
LTKVLHLTGWPIPETLAGTEVYVTSLCCALPAHGVEAVIGCADPLRAGTVTEYRGLPIHHLGPAAGPASGPPFDFGRWLKGVDPDIVHVHALTRGLGKAEVDVIARAGHPVVFTAHVPGTVCHRGTMMWHDQTPCDGEMRVDRCTVCLLQQRGLPAWAGSLLTALPERLRVGLAVAAPRKVATGLRLTAQLREYFANMHATLARFQRVIAVCQWLYDALALNGVPASRLVLSRQATDLPEAVAPKRQRRPGEALHVGYLGRYDPIKGVETLVQAVAQMQVEVPVRLTLHGAADGCNGTDYLAKLRTVAAGDPRITIGGILARGRLAEFFATVDVLAVPSTWLETGPLVVYEALAHRTPVLGSSLGGIAELVRDGVDGWLVPAGDVGAWQRQLQNLATREFPLPVIDAQAPALRSWDQAAAEMAALYSSVLEQPACVPAAGMR